MRWKKARRSDNVVDARGRSGGFRGGRLSLAGVAVVVVIGLLSGQDPLQILGQLANQAGSPTTQQSSAPANGDDPQVAFVQSILGDTEDTWRALFQQAGAQYRDPTLVLFRGGVRSACGFASSAVGPFYCPGDRQVYLDLQFFDEMASRFSAAGDFAQAYVIAHEVGHHVQTLLGVSQQMQAARQRGARMEGDNGLLVRQELQADCFAGVWAYHAQQRHEWLEDGDLEDALNAANAIGDDRLQQQSQGRVVPDAFTHGTSAQRVRWFRSGFEHGDPARCDTFKASRL
ncbi:MULTISPECIES: KPN_02809 family neutral zinc metallopeptidase [Pseudomonadaceae]|jgi:predicted metalloprotease|uniref:KPN_02809 family neutral zinc metallopeptidase n=1 Tax=Pseudomonadaceae TaxID=135621 RepID=UPI000F7AE3E9|nr:MULTISPECIES: neutral zinc metallopeptidase [Pseudomonadaceae]MBE7929175.1 neutral zinc metallopeptidase [Pseudomonas saudiphocaensis]MCF6783825.1 neutral zinc metallopeptidase [Stutzerimonas stutzeri]MCF6806659.1 neutral zinc metallopeptidase [Stutzerimonas stutzeri]RRV12614.1 neutral zinc metallopeptidase [Pseudomonas saudiphocaensis]